MYNSSITNRMKIFLGLLLTVSLISNLVLGIKFLRGINHNESEANGGQSKYKYLSQRIFVENPNDVFVGLTPLRTALKEEIAKYENRVSLYFEYLPSGASIGINERDEYPLASLFKLPVVISTITRIEDGLDSWDKELVMTADVIDKNFGSWWQKGEGAKVTLRQAVEAAITQSDNTAHFLLMKNLTTEEINDVYRNLDFGIENTKSGPAFLGSAKSYASVFRALYLSSLLKEEDAEMLLELLMRTNFSDRIPAGVGEGVRVAHKIGVYEIEDLGSTIYSDCGIVYIPKRPYILCMMFEGTEEQTREQMQTLSKLIYEYMIRVNPTRE